MIPHAIAKRWTTIGLVVVALIVGGGLFSWFMTSRSRAVETETPEMPAVAVTAEPVRMLTMRRTVRVVGSLYGRDEIQLTPKVDGPIVEILHDVGDVVAPGELLMQIDPTDYRLAVDEARRALDLELTRLGLTRPSTMALNVKALPMVVRAAAMREGAADKRERVYAVPSSTAEERQQVTTDLAVAEANHYQTLLDAETALATVRQRQAVLATAEQRLKDTEVRVPTPQVERGDDPAICPMSLRYVVCQRSIGKGETARVGFATPLVKLLLDHTLKLQAQAPERYFDLVKEGQAVELEIEAYPGQRFPGLVARLSPMIDRVSRTFLVEIHVPNPEQSPGRRRLRTGCFARVDILIGSDAAKPAVPEEAIVRYAGVVKVFLLNDGFAREVPVDLGGAEELPQGRRSRRWIEVLSPLPADALVITSGMSQLSDGAAVRLRTPPNLEPVTEPR